ncbi:MAG TPA: type II toxin-antitoxin system HicB family antitoxin [Microbacterium sp.]|nr:type II toxin-antitoxin system HicB family antitoxin [Microbacterium sp.]
MKAHHRAVLDAAEPYEIAPGHWLVELDRYPGVWAVGDSREQCLKTLAEVLEDWLTVKRAHGDDIPGEPQR